MRWGRRIGVTTIMAAACAAFAAASAAASPPGKLRAGELAGGPRIVGDGVLWSAPDGVRLTTRRGSTSTVAPGLSLLGASVDRRWMALVGDSGPVAGPIGGSLRPVPTGDCDLQQAVAALQPAEAGQPSRVTALAPPFAVSGAELYELLPASCGPSGEAAQAEGQVIVAVDLRNWHSRELARVPAGPSGLAAAQGWLALTERSSAGDLEGLEGTTSVEVLHADGRRAYSVSAPAQRPDTWLQPYTQIDERGDVLVSEARHSPPPGPGRGGGWWASPSEPSAHPLPAELVLPREDGTAPGLSEGAVLPGMSDSEERPDAALAAGRIAYATYAKSDELLDLLDLRGGPPRTVLEVPPFPDTGKLLGLDLSGHELAWAQQSIEPVESTRTDPQGVQMWSCAQKPLGPPLIETVALGSLRARPIVMAGLPGPQTGGVPCTAHEK